jgi:hypothetical protein
MAPEHRTDIPPVFAGGNSVEAVYPACSVAKLQAAAVRAATELGFSITARNDGAGSLFFHVRGFTGSWPGEEMAAVISPHGDGAQIVVGGRRTRAYRLELADWHAAKALSLMFLDRVTAVLPTVAEPRPSAPVTPAIPDQLKALADLRDRGLLTEDEFSSAKQKLLD